MRGKTIGFRPTPTIEAYVEEQMKERIKDNPKITKSQIIIDTLHIFLSETGEGTGDLYSMYPPNLICPADNTVYMLETILESCKHCRMKRNCPCWKRTSATVKQKKEGNVWKR